MRQTVEALAERGTVNVSRLIEHDGDVEFADEHRSVPVVAGSKENPVTTVVGWQQPDVLALVCVPASKNDCCRLDEEIVNEADDDDALTHEERERRAAEVQSDLLSANALNVRRCVWRGHRICRCEFRPDTDPVALLNLALVVCAGGAIARVKHRTRHRPHRWGLNTNRAAQRLLYCLRDAIGRGCFCWRIGALDRFMSAPFFLSLAAHRIARRVLRFEPRL